MGPASPRRPAPRRPTPPPALRPRFPPPAAPPLALLMLFLALAAGVEPSSGQAGQAEVAPPHTNSTTAVPRPAIKDIGFGLSGFGRGGLDSAVGAVFNKVAKGTTATPITTRPPAALPTTTTPAPTTARAPPTTVRPATAAPVPTEPVPLRPPPPPPPSLGAGIAGLPPTRRPQHPLPDYPAPSRPPPMPAEYNPFGNKAILRGSQSEVGSAGSQRRAQPHLVPPGPLIPLRPNSPAQGGAPATPERPERPFRPDRPDLQPARPGSAGKHHLDSHIHTVDRASIPAPAPALAPVGHHQGSHGHGHNHAGTGHDFSLKAAKPTELLEQVNKDQIIDVQAEVAVVADPAIHRDEDNRDKVLLAPVTSPPSSDARPGAAGGGPVAGAAGGEWHLAWTAQVYGLATMWGVLTGLCMVAAVLVDSRTRLVPRVHFNMLLALLLAVALANSYSLFFDVINYDKLQLLQQMQQQEAPQTSAAAPAAGAPAAEVEEAAAALRVPQLLADVSLPFLPAAFSVFFFVVLRVNHVPCGSSGVPQTPAFLVLLFLFLATTMSLEVASFAVAVARGARSSGGLCIAARGLTVCGSALLGLAYLVVYRPLRRAAAKKQAEQLRAAYTAFRRLPTPALPRVVNALLVCALLLMGLAGLAAYRLMDVTLVGSNTDWSLPPWWYLRLAEHVGSLLVGFLLLWCATRGPSRGADERATSTASRSSRGTSGALSLVSRNGMRFLFDCPSTGSEENKTSEDNTYPTVCASNHAILNYTQHTGNKLYDDSFPLANVHSAPLNSSGDDFCNVPTMPKRAERAERASRTATVTAGPGKAGTLGPYSKGSRRTAAPGPGHHTLGPGGQLYDADDREARDTLRKGSRTTGRTRRTRLGRHHQEVYSNCPQDDVDLDGLADEFTVFKQYNNSTGSSESADNYDVPMLVSAPAVDARDAKRHRRRDRNGGVDEDGRVIGALQHGGGGHPRSKVVRHGGPADSLSPASPSDLSDCDRLSSNRSSYDEAAPPALRHAVPHANHHANHHHHHHHRGKAGKLLYDASEDDVTPDSAVVADITTSSPRTGGLHSPRDKRPGRRLARRHQHLSQESPSSPELHDTVWSPQ